MHNDEMRQIRLVVTTTVIAILVIASLAMFVPLLMRYRESSFTYVRMIDVPQTDAALVLGASVRRGKPSPILEERAHRAVELYLVGKIKKILVTGDNGALSHDEVTPVRKYLIDAGIPAADIFLDHAGFDTYSSLYRARTIFGATSLTIVTQDFHLPRALFIAHSLGLVAYGVEAQGIGSGSDYMREVPASIKAVWDLVTHREPKYLGDQIPLTGDGSTTWY